MDFNEQAIMDFVVKETTKVLEDLDDFTYYLLVEKQSIQAARAIADDYDRTIEKLAEIAGSLKVIEGIKIDGREIRKIRFRQHNYFLIYEVDGNKVIVHRMFHDLQDLDGALKD